MIDSCGSMMSVGGIPWLHLTITTMQTLTTNDVISAGCQRSFLGHFDKVSIFFTVHGIGQTESCFIRYY